MDDATISYSVQSTPPRLEWLTIDDDTFDKGFTVEAVKDPVGAFAAALMTYVNSRIAHTRNCMEHFTDVQALKFERLFAIMVEHDHGCAAYRNTGVTATGVARCLARLANNVATARATEVFPRHQVFIEMSDHVDMSMVVTRQFPDMLLGRVCRHVLLSTVPHRVLSIEMVDDVEDAPVYIPKVFQDQQGLLLVGIVNVDLEVQSDGSVAVLFVLVEETDHDVDRVFQYLRPYDRAAEPVSLSIVMAEIAIAFTKHCVSNDSARILLAGDENLRAIARFVLGGVVKCLGVHVGSSLVTNARSNRSARPYLVQAGDVPRDYTVAGTPAGRIMQLQVRWTGGLVP